jgi:hypothetical protein
MVAKVPVLWGYSPFSNRYYTKTCGEPVLANSALGADRIWFSPRAASVPLTDAAFDRLAKRSAQLGRPCLVVSRPDSRAEPAPLATGQTSPTQDGVEELPGAESAKVKLLAYRPEELVFDLTCPSRGWILVTDRWAQGWQATVNGRKETVSIGNFVFRAVPVEEGANHVCFTYRPFGHPWLLLASWTTLGVLLLGSFQWRWGSGERRAPQGPRSPNLR